MNLRGWRVSHNKKRHIHIPNFLSCYAETLYPHRPQNFVIVTVEEIIALNDDYRT